MDYIEIQQLYGRYDRGCDEGNGKMVANAFAPDGVMLSVRTKLEGRAQLEKKANCNAPGNGPLNVVHLVTDVLIEPTPEGARGYARMFIVRNPKGSKELFFGGVMEDDFVKTGEGWRIKKRVYFDVPAVSGADEFWQRGPSKAATY